jgi:hypothetical protein
MSGIYIKGMEMPTSCLECDWCAHTIPADNYICYRLNRAVIGVAKEDVDESVNVCCPLVPVPPHGRLIDESTLLKGCGYIIADGMACIPVKHIANAPTIIPEEEGET